MTFYEFLLIFLLIVKIYKKKFWKRVESLNKRWYMMNERGKTFFSHHNVWENFAYMTTTTTTMIFIMPNGNVVLSSESQLYTTLFKFMPSHHFPYNENSFEIDVSFWKCFCVLWKLLSKILLFVMKISINFHHDDDEDEEGNCN